MELKKRICEGDGRVVLNSLEIWAMRGCSKGEMRVGRSTVGEKRGYFARFKDVIKAG